MNIHELHSQLETYIKENIYSSSMTERLSTEYNRLLAYMKEKSTEIYTPELGKTYLKYRDTIIKKRKYHHYDARYITLLNGMLQDRWILKISRTKYDAPFPGRIGPFFTKFLEEHVAEKRLKTATRNNYYRSLYKFCERMEYEKIIKLKDITAEKILDFMSSVKNCKDHSAIILRAALKKLYNEGMIDRRTSKILDHLKIRVRNEIQTYFTADEILRLEQSINRSIPKGKRDYAMILLATRLGLRSSDIRYLKFSNIDWKNNIIRLEQFKTKVPIELPLLVDIGEALIDYIKNGRPKIKSKDIFLRANGPYTTMTSTAFHNNIREYLKKANIDYSNRKHGSHALRHSLATNLLKNRVPISIISDVLGHSDTTITMDYLHISVENLLECSLDVPIVDPNFYLQANFK
ncbi:tyrosine-type recombinase/integrase [Chryseobacterium arthrosphaerae]|uniref:tyrosine-type recombinase/integrase n=1 Tax=Chryseobacterium arthrosphaerae TaxID=651561 RepID=UPI001BAE5804|nr:tyrosine-type recombinase/integrase [Chryseobacterium arthrosphaerae]QUY55453.1 tyrosine-type recombinase/integrase [Chryseobacterium arthrosphaerae]